MISAYPLQWPSNIPRSKLRERGAFKTTLPNALKNVQDSLRKFAGDSGKKLERLVISSNVTLGVSRPPDPGVAVWFTWDGLDICVAVDRYQTVEANLQAIHHIIEARRVELRHGTLALVRAVFTGLTALPPASSREWWEVLGVSKDASQAEIKEAYRLLSMVSHPDKGGDQNRQAEINAAYKKACTQ